MKLYEFFGHINLDHGDDKNKDPAKTDSLQEEELLTSVFEFILDDDELHKKHFMPIAKNIKKAEKDGDPKTDSKSWKLWIPMVNAGCMKYYKEHDVKKHPNDAFTKEVRKELCQKLADHYHPDIIKNIYELGL